MVRRQDPHCNTSPASCGQCYRRCSGAFLRFRDRLAMARPSERAVQIGFELAMTSWADLTPHEKTALRHLPKGEVHDVPFRLIRHLRALGLADDSPDDRPTAAAWSSTGPSRDRQTAANDHRRPNPTGARANRMDPLPSRPGLAQATQSFVSWRPAREYRMRRARQGGRVQRAEIPVSLFAEAIDGDQKKAPPAAVRWLATTQGRRLDYRRTCPLVRRNERRGSAALIARLERCIFRSRRRTTWCEFSARLFLRANPVGSHPKLSAGAGGRGAPGRVRARDRLPPITTATSSRWH